MNDLLDFSSETLDPSPSTRSRSTREANDWSVIDILGVILLLVVIALLTGCQTAQVEPSLEPPAQATVASDSTVAPTSPSPPSPSPTPNRATASDQITLPQATSEASPVELTPTIGEITFARDVTPAYEPIGADLFFSPGITEVHAVFEYSGMQPGDTWERIWYLNDKEVARVTDIWQGAEAGLFDYFIDNGGRPLPSGDWLLELYVADELRSLGVFIIESEEQASRPANSTYPLVYTKCEGSHHHLYVADTAGRNEQLIVTRGAGPSWSPGDGAIFFFGEAGIDRQQRDGLEYIFDGLSNGLVALDASPVPTTINQLNMFQSLAWKQGTARWARVSPDGSMVAFDAKPSGQYRIYFLGTDDNQQFRYEILGEQADWSPDSQRVVYRSGRDGQTGLWISQRDDTDHRLLTNSGSDAFPAWSPDGQTIAFSREAEGNVDIYTINVDGSGLQRLTTAAGHDTLPTYTPDGQIIFRTARTGQWAIWKMNGDGTNQTEIIAEACVGDDWAYSRMDVAD